MRISDWSSDVCSSDLVRVVAAPGHHPGQVVFHDDRTGLVFTGDYLLPGRLLVDDAAAYRASTQRVIDFLGDRTVTHVLGGHVEMNVDGELYPRSEEHTSELQSLMRISYAVFCLKKKTNNKIN